MRHCTTWLRWLLSSGHIRKARYVALTSLLGYCIMNTDHCLGHLCQAVDITTTEYPNNEGIGLPPARILDTRSHGHIVKFWMGQRPLETQAF